MLLFSCDLTFLSSLDMNVEADGGTNLDTDYKIQTYINVEMCIAEDRRKKIPTFTIYRLLTVDSQAVSTRAGNSKYHRIKLLLLSVQ